MCFGKKGFPIVDKKKAKLSSLKKRRVFNAIEKTFYSKKPIVFAKHMI